MTHFNRKKLPKACWSTQSKREIGVAHENKETGVKTKQKTLCTDDNQFAVSTENTFGITAKHCDEKIYEVRRQVLFLNPVNRDLSLFLINR